MAENLFKMINLPDSVIVEDDVLDTLSKCITEYQKGSGADGTLPASGYSVGELEKSHFGWTTSKIDLNSFYKTGIFHIRANQHQNSPFADSYGFTLIMDTNGANGTSAYLKTQIAIGGENLTEGDGRNQIWIRNSDNAGSGWREWVCIASPWTFPMIYIDPVNGDDHSTDFYSETGTPIKTLDKLGELLYYSVLVKTNMEQTIMFKTGTYNVSGVVGFNNFIGNVNFADGVNFIISDEGNIDITNSKVHINVTGAASITTASQYVIQTNNSQVDVVGEGTLTLNTTYTPAAGNYYNGVKANGSSVIWQVNTVFNTPNARGILFDFDNGSRLVVKAATYTRTGAGTDSIFVSGRNAEAYLESITIPNTFNTGMDSGKNAVIHYSNITNNATVAYTKSGGLFDSGDTGWVSVTDSSDDDHGVKVRKIGTTVYVTVYKTGETRAANTEVEIAQLPEQYRSTVPVLSTFRGVGGAFFGIRYQPTDGKIMYYSTTADAVIQGNLVLETEI